jgi:Ran GTPase-activating protein (RanGAP) involved in mRNA processing and transport
MLEELEVLNTQISVETGHQLEAMLASITNLTSLKLENCGLGNDQIVALGRGLAAN